MNNLNEQPIAIEKAAMDRFMKLWSNGRFDGQRLGQAFYNHFDLHKMVNQDGLLNIYEKDGDEAMITINTIVLQQ